MTAFAATAPLWFTTHSPPLPKPTLHVLCLAHHAPRFLSASPVPIRAISIPQSGRKTETKARNKLVRMTFRFVRAGSDESVLAEDVGTPDNDFVVVNFYHFVRIKDPEAEVSRHLSFSRDLDIRGRIYLSEQGINAQYSGPSRNALAYVEWLREDPRFSDALIQVSAATNGHAFPKLKLRYKPSLVQVEGGILHLPLFDPSMRATPLPPSEWRKKLQAANDDDHVSNVQKSCILLDVRNGYEWDIGHFCGALRPDVDCFRSTSSALSQLKDSAVDPLDNVDKDKTDILMYCTSGIRCDIYSTLLRAGRRGSKTCTH